jgi:cof-like hydrolase
MIYDTEEEKSLWKGFLDIRKVFEIIDICEKNSIYYNIYTEDEILTEKLQYNLLFYHKENIYKEKEKRTNINIVNNVKDYIIRNNITEFLKITVCDNSKLVFNNILLKLKKVKNVEILDSSFMTRKVIRDGTKNVEISYHYTEISAENINKWRAIEELSRILNISKEEIMAIGDNVNDIQMIENSKIGVAMGNSWDEIKLRADYITKSNDEDGVVEAIEKFCKI